LDTPGSIQGAAKGPPALLLAGGPWPIEEWASYLHDFDRYLAAIAADRDRDAADARDAMRAGLDLRVRLQRP
jgi:hypothetical protein